MLHHSRREFLRLAVGVPLLGGTRELAHKPLISVQDFAQFPSILTPTDDFFIRNHFDVPVLDTSAYRLQLRGLVEREMDFSFAELAALPSARTAALLECAGNGVGVGAVGCTVWEGPLIRKLLEVGGIKPETRFVRFTGADRGSEVDAQDVAYSRTLPLAAALEDSTILALKMNGKGLSPAHGAPVRVLAAGRYGMDSVKWLRSVELLDRSDDSFYMTQRFRRVNGTTPAEVLGSIKIKSLIVDPLQNQPLRGSTVIAGGYAWAGPQRVQRVSVRIDGGAYANATFEGNPEPFSWVPWRFQSGRLGPGIHSIESRALSESREAQPEQRDLSRTDAYELNQVQKVSFYVRP